MLGYMQSLLPSTSSKVSTCGRHMGSPHPPYNTPAEFLLAWRSQGWEPLREREESSTSSLLPELQFSIHSITGSYARTAATSAYIGLTVHRARCDAYPCNLTGWCTTCSHLPPGLPSTPRGSPAYMPTRQYHSRMLIHPSLDTEAFSFFSAL